MKSYSPPPASRRNVRSHWRRRLLAALLLLSPGLACAAGDLDAARQRLTPALQRMPGGQLPQQLLLLAIKQSYRLELWGSDADGHWTRLRTYPIMAFSGGPGPKLLEGDLQVPEGVYRPVAFNPNSRYHLSLKLNYPNAFDRRMALNDGRRDPGSNIFIHGQEASSGCLAMGNTVIEELYWLVSVVGLRDTRVVITPVDPRRTPLRRWPSSPSWTDDKYRRIEAAVAELQPQKKQP
ncbi:L,D-transpeptidase family protein [Ferrimonas kyonanensis]|uniref:L,D-transpeptidase family protein n=1 Tax=Ferrimonas kyonanensis TaxID=364763 RepID=UPI001FDF7437|nr:L,D-transpeptidase family protein [Ferrimonas kyonanensis]